LRRGSSIFSRVAFFAPAKGFASSSSFASGISPRKSLTHGISAIFEAEMFTETLSRRIPATEIQGQEFGHESAITLEMTQTIIGPRPGMSLIRCPEDLEEMI
jgi:hypothetical protein